MNYEMTETTSQTANPEELKRRRRQERILKNSGQRLAKITYSWSEPCNNLTESVINHASEILSSESKAVRDSLHCNAQDSALLDKLLPAPFLNNSRENLGLKEKDAFSALLEIDRNVIKDVSTGSSDMIETKSKVPLLFITLGLISALVSTFFEEFSSPIVLFLTAEASTIFVRQKKMIAAYSSSGKSEDILLLLSAKYPSHKQSISSVFNILKLCVEFMNHLLNYLFGFFICRILMTSFFQIES